MTPTEAFMQALAEGIDEGLNGPNWRTNKKMGFALLVYPFGEPDRNRINYIGNGKREDVLIALKELVARWEGQYHDTDNKHHH